MPLLGFKKRFAPAVESGDKRQTIRAPRKRGDIGLGDRLYLYTGLRTDHCRKLGEATCTAVTPVKIGPRSILLGREWLNRTKRNEFAIADGFGSFDELVEYFVIENGRSLPWRGFVIYWGAL